MNLADVFVYCMLNGYPTDGENKKCDCGSCKGKEEKSEKPIKQEEKKETKQSLKDELQELQALLNNFDESGALKFNPCVYLGLEKFRKFTALELVRSVLETYQKPKELTLEEKLIADGWKKYENILTHGNLCIYFGMETYDDIIIYTKNEEKSLRITQTEDYEIIKKAVELVRSM